MRYVFGPSFGAKFHPAVPAVVAPIVKKDVQVTLDKTSIENEPLKVTIPPYNVSEFNVLAEIRAYLLPPIAAVPATPEAVVASAFPFASADVSTELSGASFDLPLPTVPDGDYQGVTVLGFSE